MPGQEAETDHDQAVPTPWSWGRPSVCDDRKLSVSKDTLVYDDRKFSLGRDISPDFGNKGSLRSR